MVIALVVIAPLQVMSGESALVGWQAVPHGETGRGDDPPAASNFSQVFMEGPAQMNKVPEKKGSFAGEYLTPKAAQPPKLTAIYKLSLDEKGELQSRKVQFKISPEQIPVIVRVDAVHKEERVKTRFTTETLAFEPGESFVLIFKTKGSASEETEMIVLNITFLIVHM